MIAISWLSGTRQKTRRFSNIEPVCLSSISLWIVDQHQLPDGPSPPTRSSSRATSTQSSSLGTTTSSSRSEKPSPQRICEAVLALVTMENPQARHQPVRLHPLWEGRMTTCSLDRSSVFDGTNLRLCAEQRKQLLHNFTLDGVRIRGERED